MASFSRPIRRSASEAQGVRDVSPQATPLRLLAPSRHLHMVHAATDGTGAQVSRSAREGTDHCVLFQDAAMSLLPSPLKSPANHAVESTQPPALVAQ
jgi:hypothetical protein